MISDHAYYLPALDATFSASLEQRDVLRLAYVMGRADWAHEVTRFDGASMWTAPDGKKIVRVTRRSSNLDCFVETVDLDANAVWFAARAAWAAERSKVEEEYARETAEDYAREEVLC